MPWTNFPNGISVTTGTGTVSGHINATTGSFSGLFTAGTVSAGTLVTALGGTAGVTFIGERAYITGTFTSAAATFVVPCPFAGNVVDVITTCDTTPRTSSGFTLQAGSAGTIGVATVALVFATAIGQQVRPTLTAFAITTASAFLAIVTTAGSAANFGYTIVLEKSA